MVETQVQSYENHRRFYPLYHFVAVPLLLLNLIVRIVYAIIHRGARLVWWEIVFAVALLAFALAARVMVLSVQDRLIMLEERLRMQRLLPADLQPRIGELSRGQLVGLRFCSDAELPELTHTVLADKVSRGEIKKRIKTWRADHVRA